MCNPLFLLDREKSLLQLLHSVARLTPSLPQQIKSLFSLPKMTSDDKDNKSVRLTLTRNNWPAFQLKFKIAAMQEKVWQYIDPEIPIFKDDSNLKPTATELQNLMAISFLAERVHDDIAWLLESGNPDMNARTAWKNLQAEIGKSRQSSDDVIEEAKELKLTSANTDAFFSAIDQAVNRIRSLGVSEEEFGNKHIAKILIKGLPSTFDSIKAPLLLTHSGRTWEEGDEMPLEVIKRQITRFIKDFNPEFPRTRTRGDRGDRGERNRNGGGSGNGSGGGSGRINSYGGAPGGGRRAPKWDASKPHCKACFTLLGKVFNNHTEDECSNKANLARANAAFVAEQEANKAAQQYLILDSGATFDMVADQQCLMDYVKFDRPRPVVLGDNTHISALGKGTLVVKSLINGEVTYAPFYNTLLVPKLGTGLISVPVMMRSGIQTEWRKDVVNVYNNGKVVLQALLQPNNLLKITGVPLPSNEQTKTILNELKTAYTAHVSQNHSSYSAAAASTDGQQFLLWHRRLGHLGASTLLKTAKQTRNLDLKGQTSMDSCDTCVVANAKRAPHKTSASKSTAQGELLHMDHRIFPDPTINGEVAYLLTVDDSDHWADLTLVKSLTAAETASHFRKIEARMEVEQGKTIGAVDTIRTDEHGAFEKEFKAYLDSRGIRHELTVRYEHESAGFIERMNRTIGERSSAQMVDADVPMPLEGYSYLHAAAITNRLFTTTEGTTPFEKRYGTQPDMSHFRIFYCPAVVTIPKELQRKTNPAHGIRCRYLGRSPNHKADVFIEVATHRIITSNAATFFEDWKTNKTIDMSKFALTFDEEFDTDSAYNPSDRAEGSDEVPIPEIGSELNLGAMSFETSRTVAGPSLSDSGVGDLSEDESESLGARSKTTSDLLQTAPKFSGKRTLTENIYSPPPSSISSKTRKLPHKPGQYHHPTKGIVQFEPVTAPAKRAISGPPIHSTRRPKTTTNPTIYNVNVHKVYTPNCFGSSALVNHVHTLPSTTADTDAAWWGSSEDEDERPPPLTR